MNKTEFQARMKNRQSLTPGSPGMALMQASAAKARQVCQHINSSEYGEDEIRHSLSELLEEDIAPPHHRHPAASHY